MILRASSVLNLIRQHSKGKAIKMTQIARALGISTREVRLSVNHLRQDKKLPICGDNSGYYFPSSRGEWERVAARLRSQAKALIDAADGGDEYYRKLQNKQESLFKEPKKNISNYEVE